MVLQKLVGTTRLENAEIFRKVRKTTYSRSPPGQSLCQWRQKDVSRPNSGGVAANFHDAQLENQTSDRLRMGGNLLVTNSSIDCESFISGLSSPLIIKKMMIHSSLFVKFLPFSRWPLLVSVLIFCKTWSESDKTYHSVLSQVVN